MTLGDVTSSILLTRAYARVGDIGLCRHLASPIHPHRGSWRGKAGAPPRRTPWGGIALRGAVGESERRSACPGDVKANSPVAFAQDERATSGITASRTSTATIRSSAGRLPVGSTRRLQSTCRGTRAAARALDLVEDFVPIARDTMADLQMMERPQRVGQRCGGHTSCPRLRT